MIVGIERLAEVLIEQEKICREVSLYEDSAFYPRQMRGQRPASPGDELERDEKRNLEKVTVSYLSVSPFI